MNKNILLLGTALLISGCTSSKHQDIPEPSHEVKQAISICSGAYGGLSLNEMIDNSDFTGKQISELRLSHYKCIVSQHERLATKRDNLKKADRICSGSFGGESLEEWVDDDALTDSQKYKIRAIHSECVSSQVERLG
jgi:Spy/CpxP family protein refolding chaperone